MAATTVVNMFSPLVVVVRWAVMAAAVKARIAAGAS